MIKINIIYYLLKWKIRNQASWKQVEGSTTSLVI